MQSKFTTLKFIKDTWTSDPAVHNKVHSSGSFVKYLDLWPSDIQKVQSSEILVNIWTSEPRAAEKKAHYFGS